MTIRQHAGRDAAPARDVVTRDFGTVELGPGDLDALLVLHDAVIAHVDRSWVRENTPDMLLECLTGHTCIATVAPDGSLSAAAILYDGGTGPESIRGYLTDKASRMERSVNLKLVLTHPEHRGKGLASLLVTDLERRARLLCKEEVMYTIHPDNAPSRAMFERIGYEKVGRVESRYGPRDIFTHHLTHAGVPAEDARCRCAWSRVNSGKRPDEEVGAMGSWKPKPGCPCLGCLPPDHWIFTGKVPGWATTGPSQQATPATVTRPSVAA